MSDRRCRECRHRDNRWRDDRRWGNCREIDDRAPASDDTEVLALVQSSGYHDAAYLITREDFGCVLFEPREEP